MTTWKTSLRSWHAKALCGTHVGVLMGGGLTFHFTLFALSLATGTPSGNTHAALDLPAIVQDTINDNLYSRGQRYCHAPALVEYAGQRCPAPSEKERNKASGDLLG